MQSAESCNMGQLQGQTEDSDKPEATANIFWGQRVSATLWSDFPSKYRCPVFYMLSNTNAKLFYIFW